MIKLGDTIRDKISGFEGIATSKIEGDLPKKR